MKADDLFNPDAIRYKKLLEGREYTLLLNHNRKNVDSSIIFIIVATAISAANILFPIYLNGLPSPEDVTFLRFVTVSIIMFTATICEALLVMELFARILTALEFRRHNGRKRPKVLRGSRIYRFIESETNENNV